MRAKMKIEVEYTQTVERIKSRQAGFLMQSACGLFSERERRYWRALGVDELGGIKAGPDNRSRIRCRKLRWGRVKRARGRRGNGRDGGARGRRARESDGMGGCSL
jgi:hypothetical protein